MVKSLMRIGLPNWRIIKQRHALVSVNYMLGGNFGDCKSVADGVWALRIDWGPGYRVYYAQSGNRLVLLLTGGDKRKQQADIDAAGSFWND